MEQFVPIGSVHVVDRHRSRMGDLSGLADSIRESGLLHAIVVTADHRLVAGHRRLEACRLLGMDEVPVRVVSNLTTARSLLFAERDENTCRLDMTPSEKVSLGLALEELERPKAQERKGRRTDLLQPKENISLGSDWPETPERIGEEKISPPTQSDRTGKVYDLVGEAVGMSGMTYKRAKAVVAAANGNTLNGDTLPAAVQAVAQTALVEMDRTGKVAPAVDAVDKAKRAAGIQPRHVRRPERPSAPSRFGGNRRKHLGILDAIVNSIAGAVMALEGVDTLDASVTQEEATRLTGDLSTQITALRRIHSLIKERTP